MRKYLLPLLFFALLKISATAQEYQEVYKSDTTYIRLNQELSILVSKQDSMSNKINNLKSELVNNVQNKDSITNVILDIESSMFDVRSLVAEKTTQINGIKQDYILDSFDNGFDNSITVNVEKNSKEYIDDFMKENLSEEEYSTVNKDSEVDSLAKQAVNEIDVMYSQLIKVDSLYLKCDSRTCADSLEIVIDSLNEEISKIDIDFSDKWNKFYDTKLYAYKRILDYLNIEQYIQYDLDKKERELSYNKTLFIKEYIAPNLNIYSKQRNFLRQYEIVIATKKGDKEAIEHLNLLVSKSDSLSYDKKKVILPDWQFIDYKDIVFGKKTYYSSVEDIPYIELPTNGVVYSLRVYLLSGKMKYMSSFKGARPAYYLIDENGKYQYYLGTFRTEQEANKYKKKLKSKGLVSLVVKFEDEGRISEEGHHVPLYVDDFNYSVEVDMLTPELIKIAKKVAPTLSFAKIDNKFVIGIFYNYSEALKVKNSLGAEARLIKTAK